MKYISTRGHVGGEQFCDILLGGLAPDGGLYLPEAYPQISKAELASGVICRMRNWRLRFLANLRPIFCRPFSAAGIENLFAAGIHQCASGAMD